MPIEIRELVIKATVTEASPSKHEARGDLSKVKKEIVTECVEAVWEKLTRKAER